MYQTQRMFSLAGWILLSASLGAQTTPNPSGHWEGSIKSPEADVKIEVDLTRTAKGDLAGAINIPDQNLRALPLGNFAREGQAISFQVRGKAGERKFKGVLSADAHLMTGTYVQGDYTMPFELAWTGAARLQAATLSAPISKALEGTWNGTIDVDGTQKQLVLTMSNQAGGSEGNIVVVDEGLDVPVAAITRDGAALRLDLKAVGGVFAGTVNADTTEVAGTLTQGSLVVPLTFRKK